MNGLVYAICWIAAVVAQVTFGVMTLRDEPAERKRHAALMVSAIASILPLVTLGLFLHVFIIGGSSNVAQLAGEAGMDRWSLWLRAWPVLSFGSPLAFLGTIVANLLPPYPPRHWQSFASRACGVASAAISWYIVVRCFPDA